MRIGTIVTALPVALIWIGLVAGPASADPAGATNYRSSIRSVEPPAPEVEVDIRGGDAFAVLSTDPGTTASVEGYDGEPYLRFLEDGTVERNAASPARWLNDARYGGLQVTVPPEASADAPPRWEIVAEDGTYAWHDHRIHWMSPTVPRQVDTAADSPQLVQDWEIPIAVNDQPVTIAGRLQWLPSRSPLPIGAVALGVLAIAGTFVLRRPSAATSIAAAGAVLAAFVGVAAAIGQPSGVPTDPARLVLPAISLLIAAVAVGLRRRSRRSGQLLGAMAAIPLLIWCWLQAGWLVAPMLPTQVPQELARGSVAAALGFGIAALMGAGRLIFKGSPEDAPPGRPPETPRDPAAGSGSRHRGHGSTAMLLLVASQPFILAHAGEGATWQALLVVISLGLVVIVGLVLAGRLFMSEPGDLVVPLAVAMIVASLAPLVSDVLSDWVGWAFPIGVVALLSLAIAALTPLRLSAREPAVYGAVAIAIMGAVTLHGPITQAWHPPVELLPLVDDAEIEIVSPADGAEVGEEFEVTIAVTGGGIGTTAAATSQPSPDPEEAGQLIVAIDGDTTAVEFDTPCSMSDPCSEVTFPLELPPGEHKIAVELRTADGMPFAPLVVDRSAITVR